MIELPISNVDRHEALAHAQLMVEASTRLGWQFHSFKGRNINNVESSYIGKLSEILVRNWFLENNLKILVSPLETKDYSDPRSNFKGDFVVGAGRHSIEVKSKTCGVRPEPHWDFGTTRTNHEGIYLGLRLNELQSLCWVVGWIPVGDFVKISTKRPAGSGVVNSSTCEFTAAGTEYICTINDLHPPNTLIDLLRGSLV